MPQEPQLPASNGSTMEPGLNCPLHRPCTLARHRVVDSLVTCIRPQAAACEKHVVFGPDAFCGLHLTPTAAGGELAP